MHRVMSKTYNKRNFLKVQVREFFPIFIIVRNDTCDILRHFAKRALRNEGGGVCARLRSFPDLVLVHGKRRTEVEILADLRQVMHVMIEVSSF
jgi:hypothetical protein